MASDKGQSAAFLKPAGLGPHLALWGGGTQRALGWSLTEKLPAFPMARSLHALAMQPSSGSAALLFTLLGLDTGL